ncbi:AraC family transcriptional regulator [Oceaniferula spumae]|uniref:AraC family transcriptional regulator n=1 Tax=Oceaniferula spumae TaxID=2979115 RepID=A0AAT9FLQ2_9BACT
MKRQHIPEIGLHNPADEFSRQGIFTHGRFEDNVREAPVRAGLHRHTFHELAIFESGTGTYLADFETYQIDAPCAVIIPSGTVHQWPDAKNLEGDIIAFDLELLAATDRSRGPAAILRPPIPTVTPLTSGILKDFEVLLKKIRTEWVSDYPHRRHVLRSCLSILLVDLLREHLRLSDQPHTAAERLYTEFLDLLEQSWRSNPPPKQFATALNVSTDHLAATLRKIAGKNTSQLIQERILLESKRQLAHSRMSVSEIAYDIGFEDPSYFTRVFRKNAGMTPKQFREESDRLHGESLESS